ncbi:MAG TPA: glycoside hydrolase family 9 protein, partial [Fibrobacteria bacterium]|nr:glycoside hydrolase family 9 protein [Fibrobacteria bacterium]
WARPAGHPDLRVHVHSSAATAARPAETVVPAPRGWYDAGDYNKYVVNSGISTYTLLALYRQFPAVFDTLGLGIPESGDAVPDILDEALWNLRWMMSMQDPNDGGAYHKLTSANFSGSIMPDADQSKRYLVRKSVTATLDLAAVCAYASRVFRKYDKELPGFADSALAVARKAWDWARANPTAYYRQADMNKLYSPPIETGEYGDGNAGDELQWAGAELYLATGIDSFYLAAFPGALTLRVPTPSWADVGALALYSMADEGGPDRPRIDTAAVRLRLRAAGAALVEAAAASAFRVPMTARDYVWGSNSVAGNMGMLLVQAYRAGGDTAFLRPAVDALDYLLGRNGPAVSFVTGFGSVSPRNLHHRPSEADGVDDPVPGLLVGGPNPGQEDKCAYPSRLPALSWSDAQCSYASNEVAINWNAPLAYLSGALHALYSSAAGPVAIGSAPAAGARPAARLAWEGGAPALVLPAALRGSLELFDGTGRAWSPRSDAVRAGRKQPGLLFYRLRVEGETGAPVVVRTGFWATAAALRISL